MLDECVPRQIRPELRGHFDVFVTVDRSLAHQQNVRGLKLGVVTLVAHSNEIEALRPLIPRLRQALRKAKAGQLIRLTV